MFFPVSNFSLFYLVDPQFGSDYGNESGQSISNEFLEMAM
jgi:hypothetical protein